MHKWFTVEQIDKETYVISEYKHWEETHCYLLIGKKKALLIDTGMGIANIKEVVDTLTDLPVEVVATHVHSDHIGGHKLFEHVAVHKAELSWLSEKFPLPIGMVINNLIKEPCDFPPGFCEQDYQVCQVKPTRILQDGDLFDLGDRTVEVIHTPGHSPGHLCFYDRERKYLYTGDLVYRGTLYAFYPTTDPLDYMESIQKIRKYDVSKVLPGHHELQIPVSIIEEIHQGFTTLYDEGKLVQGNGVFSFGQIQIHI